MLCIDFKRLEFSSAAFIKLSEELNKLQSVGMNIRAERVDADVEQMSDQKDQTEDDDAEHRVAHHRTDLVEYLRDNAGRKTESQQTAVGEDIAEIPGRPIESVNAL